MTIPKERLELIASASATMFDCLAQVGRLMGLTPLESRLVLARLAHVNEQIMTTLAPAADREAYEVGRVQVIEEAEQTRAENEAERAAERQRPKVNAEGGSA